MKEDVRDKVKALVKTGKGATEIQKILSDEGITVPYHTIYGYIKKEKGKGKKAPKASKVYKKVSDDPDALIEEIKRISDEIGVVFKEEREKYIANLKIVRLDLLKTRDELRKTRD